MIICLLSLENTDSQSLHGFSCVSRGGISHKTLLHLRRSLKMKFNLKAKINILSQYYIENTYITFNN